MVPEQDTDTSRESVRAYVPAYQKSEWERHADELDMSLSEFVRTMVQTGRRGFAGATTATDAESGSPESSEELETQILSVLEDSEPLSWDELLEAVTGDIESTVDETLQQLQASNRIQYNGREGGYVLGDR